MIKFLSVWAYCGCSVLVFGVFACPLQASAGALGGAVAHADGKGSVAIEIPISALPEELAVMTGGVRGDASCADCVPPPLQAVVGSLPEGGGILRITGPVPEKQPYLEFQAWIEWEQEGRLSGDLRNYKVDLPGITRAGSVSVVSMDDSQSAVHEQPAEVNAVRFVADWLKAWSSRDMDRYLDFYSEDFSLPVGVSRRDWENQRRQRILGRKGLLQLEFEKLVVVSSTPDRLEIRFVQTYRSVAYSSTGTKSLLLVMRDGAWKIAAESISDERPLSN